MAAVVSDTAWLVTYFPVAWAAHACQGLAMGLLGPLQPYLALKVGVSNSQINFLWTMRAVGSCLATVATGFIFKRFVKTKREKLSFLGCCVLLVGLFMCLLPLTSSFYLMLASNSQSPLSLHTDVTKHFSLSDHVGRRVPRVPGHRQQLPGGLDVGAGEVSALHPVPARHGRPRVRAGLPHSEALPA